MEFNDVRIVDKPWGREIHFAVEADYVGKILEVKKGSRLSLQYHNVKKESMYVLSGRMKFTLGDEEKIVDEGRSVTIDAKMIHRVEALEDLRIIEVSTNHLDDIVRLKDDYSRGN